MGNIKTLKPFKKGEDKRRNTLGRPKKTLLSEAIREQIAIVMPGADEQTFAEAIAATLIKLAIAGDVAAIREIADRTEGKPKQAIDVDMQVSDWRKLAQANGVTEEDVIREAKLLIAESDLDSSGETSD